MFKGLIRGGLLFLLLVLVLVPIGETQPANAIGMQPGQVVTPWSAFPLTAPITSQSYSIAIGTQGVPAITWQVTTPSAPTSFTANLQASNDGTTYATIDSTTAVGIRTVFGTYKFIQFTVSATSGGSSPTITISTVYSRGNAISTTSGAIYGGGTFTGPLLLPDGTVSAPAIGSAAESGTGFYRPFANYWAFATAGSTYIIWGSGGVITRAGTSIGFSTNPGGAAADVLLVRDAANTLALRNSTNAQTFNIYNTYTDASNYERGFCRWTANVFVCGTESAGTGTARSMQIAPQNGVTFVASFYPADDLYANGTSTNRWQSAAIARSIQGSKSKTLVDASATQFVRVSIPQTMGSNYAGGQVIYTVYARDATTGTQTLHGIAEFACINNAGTESCAAIIETTKTAAVVTGGTLTCAITAVVGLTDEIALAANCDTSLTSTALTIEYRLDMPHPNTVTPQ